ARGRRGRDPAHRGRRELARMGRQGEAVAMTRSIVFPLALAAACAAKSDSAEQAAGAPEPIAVANETSRLAVRSEAEEPRRRVRDVADRDSSALLKITAPASPAPAKPAPPGGGAAAKDAEGPTRSWFPETFLFEPLVVTDDHGAAVVPVRVPDRLTTW